jgi:hypothetical protein
MKIEKWTLGLAAVGLVNLLPALLAQNAPQLVPVQTALSATTISGYVDTSAVWNPGTGNANPAPYALNPGKQDGFNLDAVDVRIEKPLDDTQWSAGYVAEISLGPDAIAIDSGAYPIRQAYINLRTPVGNGIDWELGRWDSLLGYESSDSYKNPNWTHSYGKTFEPTENTGLLGAYKFCDAFSLQLGVADTVATGPVNARTDGGTSPAIESKKALLSLVTLTAPDSWGALKGSRLDFGVDYGQGYTSTGLGGAAIQPHDRTELYVGATIYTPVKGLLFGASWDGIEHNDVGGVDTSYFQAFAGYASYKLDKLTLSGRLEYADGLGLGALTGTTAGSTATPNFDKVFDATATLQYDLWDNVISRVEIRWDHAADGTDPFGASNPVPVATGGGTKKNDITIAANVIYKF